MSEVKLNIEELKGFMGHIIKNNQHIQAQGKVPIAVNVVGEAGLGKTSSIKQLAKEQNMEVIMLNLAEFEELGDLIGFPVKEYKVKNSEGKVLWITEQEIDTASKKGYKVVSKRMAHAAPEWIEGKGEGGILILDDYSRADHRFMQATMSLIDQQAYASWKLPKNWHIILKIK
jgi:MoxR-like ATPase